MESADILAGQGVDLVIDWSNLGVGRNALALRSVAEQSGIDFVCPTGVYKHFLPSAATRQNSSGLPAVIRSVTV